MEAGMNKERRRRGFLIIGLAVMSLGAFLAARVLVPDPSSGLKQRMLQAAGTMAESRLTLLAGRQERGLEPDIRTDINATGLIGLEYSPLTTSLGNLAAKRTTTNPDFAALVVFLLDRAGVEPGDSVAVGASSSFPALILAVLSAARALEVEPLVICSLGASQWGANDPAFHWLDMMDCLNAAGGLDVEPLAASVGGDADSGRDMDPAGAALLRQAVEDRGLLLLDEPDLERNVAARMELYEKKAGGRDIKAFINIGGSWANLGTDPVVLRLKPGLSTVRHRPLPGRQGVLFEMAGRSIPVIHLLFIKGLSEEFGLPWDPSPLPEPGRSAVYGLAEYRSPLFIALGLAYMALTVLLLLWTARPRRMPVQDPSCPE